jgi:hypothetical protein
LLYYYDVNSLYPAVASKIKIPCGNPVLSNDTILDNYFGIVYAKIESPKKDHMPLLPYRLDDARVIHPVGK